VIINGSPRVNGTTGQILSKISETLKSMDSGVEIDYVNLSKMNLIFCKGCASCYKTGVCIINDDGLEELYKRIEECDGVIFGSPTYATNVSGHLKVFFDRGQLPFMQRLRDKGCFSVVSYENYGGSIAQKVIHEQVRNSGGSISCKFLYKVVNRSDKCLNTNTITKIERLCRKYLIRIKRKNPLTFHERLVRTMLFHMGIKPHAFRNEARFRGVINRWINQGLTNRRQLAK